MSRKKNRKYVRVLVHGGKRAIGHTASMDSFLGSKDLSLSYTHTHIHIYVHTWYVVGSIIRCSRRFLATKDWLIYSFFLKFEDNFLDVKKKSRTCKL